jgi:hypothetical protein
MVVAVALAASQYRPLHLIFVRPWLRAANEGSSGRLDAVPQLLNDMPVERADQLFSNPLARDTYYALPGLIVALRQARTYEDFYHFQQELLGKVLEIQGHRRRCTQVTRRLRSGKSVPADAPELRSGADPNDPEAWELEIDVCERVDRQLRSIADALAWRIFNYDRQVIVALSRNDPPGPMVGKEGAGGRAGVPDADVEGGSFLRPPS